MQLFGLFFSFCHKHVHSFRSCAFRDFGISVPVLSEAVGIHQTDLNVCGENKAYSWLSAKSSLFPSIPEPDIGRKNTRNSLSDVGYKRKEMRIAKRGRDLKRDAKARYAN